MKKNWSHISLKGILSQGKIKKIICFVIAISIVCSISIVAFANSYDYGVFKIEALTGYNRDTDTWVQSAVGVTVGALTGSYRFGVSDYKPGGSRQATTANARVDYRSYGYTGNNFLEDTNAIAPCLVLRVGMVAPDLINGVNKFSSSMVNVGTNDVAKIQLSFTSSIPLREIILRTIKSNGSYGSSTTLVEGVDYICNGDYYMINTSKSFDYEYQKIRLQFTAKPSVTNSGVVWNTDDWEIKFNRTLMPFWMKQALNGSGSTTGTVTPSQTDSITYNYSTNLDGIYNLICILLDWQNIHFESEMLEIETMREAIQILNQQWGMLMILDTDLGIISADVTDILGAMYYSQGVTWFERLYTMMSQIDNHIITSNTSLSNILIKLIEMDSAVDDLALQIASSHTAIQGSIEDFADANSEENEEIISLLESMDSRLQAIEADLQDIMDWLDDLDLENNTHTKTFIEMVFSWIKEMLVSVVSVFSIVISIPTLGLITTYNSNGDGILGNEGAVG